MNLASLELLPVHQRGDFPQLFAKTNANCFFNQNKKIPGTVFFF